MSVRIGTGTCMSYFFFGAIPATLIALGLTFWGANGGAASADLVGWLMTGGAWVGVAGAWSATLNAAGTTADPRVPWPTVVMVGVGVLLISVWALGFAYGWLGLLLKASDIRTLAESLAAGIVVIIFAGPFLCGLHFLVTTWQQARRRGRARSG